MTSQPPQHAQGPPEFGPPPFDSELDIRDLLRRLWGYKWLLASVLVLVVGGTWLVVQQIVPRYTATAVLLLEPQERNIIELRDVVEGLNTHPQTLRSELIVMRSRELAAKAVEDLKLFDSPQLIFARKGDPLFTHLNPWRYLPAEWKAGLREFWHDTKESVLGAKPTNGVNFPMSSSNVTAGRTP